MRDGKRKRWQLYRGLHEGQLLLGDPTASAGSQPQDAPLVGRCEANMIIVPKDRNALCAHDRKTRPIGGLFRSSRARDQNARCIATG